ncbi:hypothetical protein, partial [Paracoccus sp. 22332]|uniref:hypothetical protein n=1 Tax=Paracoccus sp. 22332 TaxID=3453913 RepID=UPI003F838306
MTAYLYPGDLADHQITATLRGKSRTIERYGDVPDVLNEIAYGGRINEFVDLVSADAGVLTQQSDGTAVLDLRAETDARVINGVNAAGRPMQISASRMMSKHGWAPAEYYMLEQDANEDFVIERGENYREIWIGKPGTGWTVDSIAAAESLLASAITGAWLLAHPTYGSTEGEKVSAAVGRLIMSAMQAAATGHKIKPSWDAHFEADGDYAGFNISPNWHGESPIHPCVYRRFGNGEEPRGITFGGGKPFYPSNHVFIGISPDTAQTRNFENWLVADARLRNHFGSNAERAAGLTLYRTKTLDERDLVPKNGVTWSTVDGRAERIGGCYIAGVAGLYML